MVDLLLVYPYFNDDDSIFKYPPLGVGYIASYVRDRGYSVAIVDCTFLTEEEAVRRVRIMKPRVLGIYSMSGMKDSALRLARRLRDSCTLLICGGPLPTVSPEEFLGTFDLAVIGEGEETVLDLLRSLDSDRGPYVSGVAYLNGAGRLTFTRPRGQAHDLDSLPFPARDLYDHRSYKEYFTKHHGYTITSMVTSRGCPFDCEFCSRPVFGNTYRTRSAPNIVDEMEEISSLGYDRIWIGDDIFPLNKKVGLAIAREIVGRRLDLRWECLCRADLLDDELAREMKKAGCYRVFFGLESGNNEILRLMRKRLNTDQARRAVHTAQAAGMKVGSFFILGYPGETSETMLDTIRFASSFSFDYLSFTVPYPIPGTRLYERVKPLMMTGDLIKETHGVVKHTLIYRSEFSLTKLKFGMIKAKIQHDLRRRLGPAYTLFRPAEIATDYLFRGIR